jgi:hypothetical protein
VQRSSILAALLGACAGAAALAGCPSTTNPAILPITAVDIDIVDLLNNANLGCGAGTYDVYGYAAVVTLEDPDAGDLESADAGVAGAGCSASATGSISTGFAACYTPAVFSNLPLLPDGGALPDGGSAIYKVQIFFYNLATYNAANDMNDEKNAIAAALRVDAGGDVMTLCELPYTWTTTCIANEQGNIAVNAACNLLVQGTDPPDAGAAAPEPDARANDATEEVTDDATEENAPDADLDAPPDAPLDGDTDAGSASDATGG